MRAGVFLMSALLVASGVLAQMPEAPGDVYRAEAMKIAGDDLKAYASRACGVQGINNQVLPAEIPATRVFDNLIFLGSNRWNSWALTTSAGIILFDALADDVEAQRYIIDGLKQIGLDPAQIKYLVVMHGHGDHYGGARLIQEKYGTRVVMGETEWGVLENDVAPASFAALYRARKPERDMVIKDGETLTLGDTSVQLYVTPGHTAGTISALIPVFDKGQRHLAAFWGGTGYPTQVPLLDQYVASVQKFRATASAAGADVMISNHSSNDFLARLPLLSTRQPGAPHPFVMGTAAYTRSLEILESCVKASRADRSILKK